MASFKDTSVLGLAAAAAAADPKAERVIPDDDADSDPALKFFDAVVPDSKEKLGMRFIGTEVVKVTDACWAAKSGVEIDDEIWAINGRAFKPMDETERFRALTQKKPGG
jgi:hypothetical protein